MRTLLLTLAAGLVTPVVGVSSPVAAASPGPATNPGPQVVTVCPSCGIRSPQEGLAQLAPGGTLRVERGVYRGALVVDRPAHLVGIGNPALDGGGQGTVVRVTSGARDSSIEGFTVRGSGTSLNNMDAGIDVRAPHVTVSHNRVENVLFGIYAEGAPYCRVDGNTVTGKPGLPDGMKGDGIRAWNSPWVNISGNRVRRVRDDIIWFSPHATLTGNHIIGSRYGLHFMWSNDGLVASNLSEGNTVGLYLMWSNHVRVTGNIFRNNRSYAGMGVGMREANYTIFDHNLLVHNMLGMALYDTPDAGTPTPDYFRDNVFAYNDVGITSDGMGQDDVITSNDFIDNTQQVTSQNQDASLTDITWTKNGRGNYWSDYAGYDANGDGVGDVPYAPRQTFESLVNANPNFALLYMSPAAQAIDWAANAFPVFHSTLPVNDPAPLVHPVTAAATAAKNKGVTLPMLGGAGSLVLLGLIMVGAVRYTDRLWPRRQPDARATRPAVSGSALPIQVSGLTKAYGDRTIVDNLSFQVSAGEVVALWGDNGAGKTTVLRCLLGLVRHRGEARIAGWASSSNPREALAALGHVSQEPAFHGDLTVAETLSFYGDLRAAGRAGQNRVLELAGLRDAAHKRVTALSGGMRRKLAVAVALLGEPQVLLLDEPTANLDQHSRRDLISLLGELKASGIAMVLATHQADEVVALADRVLKLEAGGPAAEMKLPAFGGDEADGRQSAVVVPEPRREEAARVLLDAGIPLRMEPQLEQPAGVPGEAG